MANLNTFETQCEREGMMVHRFRRNMKPMPEGYAVVSTSEYGLWFWTNGDDEGPGCWDPNWCRRGAIEHAKVSRG